MIGKSNECCRTHLLTDRTKARQVQNFKIQGVIHCKIDTNLATRNKRSLKMEDNDKIEELWKLRDGYCTTSSVMQNLSLISSDYACLLQV